MENLKAHLNADPTDWLLEENNPSVRYFTLRDILGVPEEDSAVREAHARIMLTGAVPELLEKQREADYIAAYQRFYTNKYKGLVWSLIALAELGAEPCEQIREQCEYLLSHSQDTPDGGFSQNAAVKTGGGRVSEVIPCLSGNMVWSLIRLGYLDDARLQKGVNWLVEHMRLNDGIELEPQDPPYGHNETCWGRHTCHMGVVKALKAFSAIPEEKRTPETKAMIERAAEFMLIHHIHKQNHNLKKTSKPGWKKFGFPLMYQTDVLEILDIITSLGIRDERMNEALALVLTKQDELGRWHIENAYAGERMLIPFEAAGEPSKWLTLRALRILKAHLR